MTSTDQKIPIIREQTLEHIARHLGDLTTGWKIVLFLKGLGVPETLTKYSGSKWWMVLSVLKHYAYSTETKDHAMLFKIIREMLHPLMYNGDEEVAETAADDFNKYLQYDDLFVGYVDDEKGYLIGPLRQLTETEKRDIEQESNQELFEKEQNELQFLRLPENREKISTLRKAYQVFINIAEVFCDNPSKPSQELNDAYVKTKNLVTGIVNNLNLYVSSEDGVQRVHTLTHYCIPFNNLFTAEKEYTPEYLEIDLSGKKLHWDYIRPKMNATYGDIDELYRKVDGSDVLSQPDVQQSLNIVSLLLSKTREENKKQMGLKQQPSLSQIPVQKIEITNIPELRVRNVGYNTLVKSKKRLPSIELSFPEPVQWDKVILKIKEGLQEIEIFYDNSHIITADYIRFGFFVGKKQQKPDRQWGFLCALSTLAATDIKQATAENIRSMITKGKNLSINNVQQVKKLFVERLQDIFKTHNDPFHDRRDYYEPKFTILPEPALRREKIWPQGGRLNENLAYEDSEEEAL